MSKRVVPVLLLLAAAAIAVVYIAQRHLADAAQQTAVSQVISPQVDSGGREEDSSSYVMAEDTVLTSLIPLRSDETLLSLVSMDFNGDGYEDQVNAIRTASSPYIQLLVGLYNSARGTYERSAVIATRVTQVLSFTYTGMDITGDHRTALVFQGFAENGNAVLQAYFVRGTAANASLTQIASFEADGTIYIQQVDRYDAYERSQASGASYPIWVYSTDAASLTNDQLQTEYDWSASAGRYVQVQQRRVAGVRLAQREVARILDGTVGTFEAFLNGLWYKVDAQSGMCYLFFDRDSGEVVFLQDETEEVYRWINATLRRSGIYISTVNQDVENLQRRIDVSLLSADEVNVRIQDDLRMLISENSVWDGEYKKTASSRTAFVRAESGGGSLKAADFTDALLQGEAWTASDGTRFVFSSGGKYVAYADGGQERESGSYTGLDAQGMPFVQFRPAGGSPLLSGAYYASYATREDGSANTDTILLQPYTLTPRSAVFIETNPVILTRAE